MRDPVITVSGHMAEMRQASSADEAREPAGDEAGETEPELGSMHVYYLPESHQMMFEHREHVPGNETVECPHCGHEFELDTDGEHEEPISQHVYDSEREIVNHLVKHAKLHNFRR